MAIIDLFDHQSYLNRSIGIRHPMALVEVPSYKKRVSNKNIKSWWDNSIEIHFKYQRKLFVVMVLEFWWI